MPEARASRKRQIQVTPGPFSGAAASSAYLTANRVQADSLSRLFSKVFPAFSTSGLSRAFTEGFAIFSASRDGDSTKLRSRLQRALSERNRNAAAIARVRFEAVGAAFRFI